MAPLVRERELQRRAEVKAAADLREEQVKPADRVGFYLRQLQSVLSHLVDIAMGFGSGRSHFTLGGWDLLTYADVAIERAQEADVLHRQEQDWRELWEKLEGAIFSFRRWAGDGEKAAQLAKVIFVAAFVLRCVHEADRECELTGEERGFELCITEIPVPLDVTMPLAEQVKIVSQNLAWFKEQMRCEVVWPRWW